MDNEMTNKRYEIRTLPIDIGIHGEVVYSTNSREDAERLLEVMDFQGRDVDEMFICEIEIPQWK